MKVGDLVIWGYTGQIGVILDIFGDLDPVSPWYRVAFSQQDTTTFQWCKEGALTMIKKGGAADDSSP